MKNLLNGNVWLWERGKFINRRYVIQDLYQRFLDGDEDVMKLPQEEDPFWEPAEDVLIGTANVFLQSLAYALDFDDKLSITDFKVSYLVHILQLKFAKSIYSSGLAFISGDFSCLIQDASQGQLMILAIFIIDLLPDVEVIDGS